MRVADSRRSASDSPFCEFIPAALEYNAFARLEHGRGLLWQLVQSVAAGHGSQHREQELLPSVAFGAVLLSPMEQVKIK